MPERLFTTHQVGDLLGSTPGEVLQWIRKGWLQCQRLPNGPIRISERGLVQFLKARGVDLEKLMIEAALRGDLPAEPPAAAELEADELPQAETDESPQSVNDEERAMLGGPPAAAEAEAEAEEEEEDEPTPLREQAEAEVEAPKESFPEPPAAGQRPARPEEVVAEGTSPLERLAAPRLARPGSGEPAEAKQGGQEGAKSQPPAEAVPAAWLGGEPPPRPPQGRKAPFDESLPDLNELLETEALLNAAEAAARREPLRPEDFEPPAIEEAADEPPVVEADEELIPPARPRRQPQPAFELAPAGEVEAEAPGDATERMLDALLADALDRGASHLHLQPHADGLTLRMRIDGVLDDRPPSAEMLKGGLTPELAERLLALAGLGQAGASRPQAGCFARTVGGRQVELAVSAFPTLHGRRMVIRLTERDVPAGPLGELGLSPAEQERLGSIVAADGGGLVLVAGLPRGGLDAMLRALTGPLAEAGRDVLAIETPGRAELPGADRWPIDPFGPCRFADAAAGVLDQDVDVVLIDRLADPTTGKAALAAALDGAMVLAGVHAGSAGGAIGLLGEMDLEPWPLAQALKAVVAIRTVRRLCGSCRQPAGRAGNLLAELGLDRGGAGVTVYAPAGCNRCGNSGYLGVVHLASVLVPDGKVVAMVRRGASAGEIDAAARQAGARPLGELAGEALRQGLTSLEEVRRML